MVRKNDFRVSGSGNILYDKKEIDIRAAEISFKISKKLQASCIAFGFIFANNAPLITEISYGFIAEVYDPYTGNWDSEMNWHEGSFNPQSWMVDIVIDAFKLKD